MKYVASGKDRNGNEWTRPTTRRVPVEELSKPMWPNCCPRAEGTEATDSPGDQKVHFASRAPLAQTRPTTPWHRSLAHPGAARGRKPLGLGGHLQFPGARCQCPRPDARGRRVQKDTRPRQRVWFALGPSPGMKRRGEGRYGRKRGKLERDKHHEEQEVDDDRKCKNKK